MFFREGRIEVVFRQDESCGQHLNSAVLLRRRCQLGSNWLVFTLTVTLALTVVLCCGWHVIVTVAREMVLFAGAQRAPSKLILLSA